MGVIPHHIAFLLMNNTARGLLGYCLPCALVWRTFFANGWEPSLVLRPTKFPCAMHDDKLETYFCRLCNKFARVGWCNKCRTCKACVQKAATTEHASSSNTFSSQCDSQLTGQGPTCHHYWMGFKMVENVDRTRRPSRRFPVVAVVRIPRDFTFEVEDDGELYIKSRSSTSWDGMNDDEECVTNPEESKPFDEHYHEGNDRGDGYH